VTNISGLDQMLHTREAHSDQCLRYMSRK